MSPRSPQILERLLSALTAAEVEAIIADTPALADAANWKPVGGLKNNEGPIRHGADAGDALMERVTNAIDAVLERERMTNHREEPFQKSPRAAAEEWFGIPDGRLAFLMPPQKRRKLAERIRIVLEESGLERAPTVTVRDTGVGQHASDFTRTLLSINADNKVDRQYLMGAYGQGGAATYAFTLKREGGSPGYSLVVSRRPPDLLDEGQEDVVGWTIVRYNPLDEDYKNGRFEYCTEPGTGGGIPAVPAGELAEEFEPGTLLRFVQYDLQGYSTVVSAPRASMWYLSNTVLFDPVLPFLVVDRRKSYKTVKEAKGGQLDKVIIGNANRLETADEEDDDVVEHTLSHTVNLGDNGKLKVRYWVFKRRPPRESGSSDLAIDAYSDTHSAIVFSLNGQRQGRESRAYLKNNLQMGILRNYLLVQVDCDDLSKIAKKSIFSSTRDRMKQTSLYREILGEVGEILKADDDLKRIAQRLHQASAGAIAEEDRKKIEKEFSRLVEQWEARELDVLEVGRLKAEPPETNEAVDEEEETLPASPPQPMELFDVPTVFEFAAKRDPLKIAIGKRYNVRLFLNAVNDYLTRENKRGELSVLLSEGAPVTVRSTSALKMGRMSVALLPKDSAKEGDEFTLGLSVTRPGEPSLTISRKAVLVKPREKQKEKEARPVIPEIVEVLEGTEMWSNLNWTTNDVAEVNAPADLRPKIYVSLCNEDYAKQLRRKGIGEEQIAWYQRKYVTAVAFHAWLQHRDGKDADIDEATRKAELRRTVRTVIYTTWRVGEDD